MTWGIISNYCTCTYSAVKSLTPIYWSFGSAKCNYFPQQITSCLMAWVQMWAGFHGASCGRAMNTTPQREHENTIASPMYIRFQMQLGSRDGNERVTARLKAKEKVILTCKYLNLMYLLSFTTQTLYEWSILLMSPILYYLFISDPMQPGFLPLPVSWHHISQGHL